MKRIAICLLASALLFLAGPGCALVYYDAQDQGDTRKVEVGLLGSPHRSTELPGLVPVFRSYTPLEGEEPASE
jgi:hypothetical protein